jgi:hypothetical protein
MVTSPADKNNGVVNFKWVDLFNDWVSRLGLIELELKKIGGSPGPTIKRI